MTQNVEEIPTTMGDVAVAVSALTLEIVATVIPDAALANKTLEVIATHLLNLVHDLTEERSRTMISAIAKKLVRTEIGSVH
jgi:hypothetical protein